MHTYTYQQFWSVAILLMAAIMTTLSVVVLYDRRSKEGYLTYVYTGVLFVLLWQAARFLSAVAYTDQWLQAFVILRQASVFVVTIQFIFALLLLRVERYKLRLRWIGLIAGVLLAALLSPRVKDLVIQNGRIQQYSFAACVLIMVVAMLVLSFKLLVTWQQQREKWFILNGTAFLLILCVFVESLSMLKPVSAVLELLQLGLSTLLFTAMNMPSVSSFLPHLTESELQSISMNMMVFDRTGKLIYNRSNGLPFDGSGLKALDDVLANLLHWGAHVEKVSAFHVGHAKGLLVKDELNLLIGDEHKDFIFALQPLEINRMVIGHLMSAYEITEWNKYIMILKEKTTILESKRTELEHYHQNAECVLVEEERNRLLDRINGLLAHSMAEILSTLEGMPQSAQEWDVKLSEAIGTAEVCLEDIRGMVSKLKKGEYHESFNCR